MPEARARSSNSTMAAKGKSSRISLFVRGAMSRARADMEAPHGRNAGRRGFAARRTSPDGSLRRGSDLGRNSTTWTTTITIRLRLQPLQLLYERRPLQVQQLRRLSFVAAGLFERAADQAVLDAIDVAVEIDAALGKSHVRGRGRLRRLLNIGREIGLSRSECGRRSTPRHARSHFRAGARCRASVRHQAPQRLLRNRKGAGRGSSPALIGFRTAVPDSWLENFFRKCCTSSGMSSLRSRSGGR